MKQKQNGRQNSLSKQEKKRKRNDTKKEEDKKERKKQKWQRDKHKVKWDGQNFGSNKNARRRAVMFDTNNKKSVKFA